MSERLQELPRGEVFAALCVHEAAHAVTALALGLVVEEIRVDGSLRTDDATAELYGFPSDVALAVAGTRIPDECLDTHPREVLAAMAAPSSLSTGVEAIDAYGRREAEQAAEVARRRGLDPDEVAELARATVAASLDAIQELAAVLEREQAWYPDAAGKSPV